MTSPTPPAAPQNPDAVVYQLIGDDGFERLTQAFYRRVKTDDLLGPMYPEADFEGARVRLREFLVFRPTSIGANERLPVVFLWHWLGGEADKIGAALEAQAAAEKHRFIAIAPAAKGDVLLKWPFADGRQARRISGSLKSRLFTGIASKYG